MDDEAQAAIQRLGAENAPVLLRLPISHFCRKTEWGLSHAGVPFASLDVPTKLKALGEIKRANPVEKTVPVLVTAEGLIHGSHATLRWADRERRAETPSFYPDAIEQEVIQWEAYADDTFGPAVRREAYRALATDPRPYARTRLQAFKLRLAKPVFQRFLKMVHAERYEEEDPVMLRDGIARTVTRLRDNDTGYLYADHVTGADLATAALLQPMIPIAHMGGYDQVDGWGEFVQYVRTIKPGRLRRTGKRKVREEDWRAFEVLNRAGATIERPLAAPIVEATV